MTKLFKIQKLFGLALLFSMMLLWNSESAYALEKTTVGGDFTLTDHNGEKFELKQLRGKLVLIFFGYTFCPDICPTELSSLYFSIRLIAITPSKASLQ